MVVTALPARLVAVTVDTVSGYWFVVVNLIAGSLIGAWMGPPGLPECAQQPSTRYSPSYWC